jgi:hypothetical protein
MARETDHRAEPDPSGPLMERGLERTGRRLGHSSSWFLAVAVVFWIPGIVLVLIGAGWSIAFGAALLLLGCIPGTVGIGLIVSSVVARWSARHRSFA